MPVVEKITESLIHRNITRAVSDVFKTMLGREPTQIASMDNLKARAWPRLGQNVENARPVVVGTVGFLGDMNGMLYLYIDLPLAHLATCHLLGMTEQELDASSEEVVNDAIGELTNMTVGSFKNGLCDAGYPCKLTIPSILRGTNFSIEPVSSTCRQIYYFECAGHRLVTDILMKTGD